MLDAGLIALEGIGFWPLVLVMICAVLGGTAQGTVGFGAAFATVPALALFAPQLLPGAMLVAALPLTGTMAILERSRFDRPTALRLIVSRLPGIGLGTVFVALADVRALTIGIAVVLLSGVGASTLGWKPRVTPLSEWTAGIISGVTGAAAALGGPPLALLYRNADPAVMRPTLAVVWAVGILTTMTSLGLAGVFTSEQVLVGLILSLGILSGLWFGRQVVARVDAEGVRKAMLWWAGVGGFAALVRALVS